MKKQLSSPGARSTVRGAWILSLALLGACAAPGKRAGYAPEPVPCVDPVYIELKAESPDSLSEREWQRLRELDHACAAARADGSRSADDWMGGSHHGHWWMGAGLVMTAMMVAMWVR